MKHDVSPRGAVEDASAAPRARSLAALARTKTGRATIWLGALGVAVWLARWAGQEDATPASQDVSSPLFEIKSKKSWIVRKEGKKYWEITAGSVLLSPDGNTTTAQNVSKGVLYRDGKPFLTMKSPSVRLSNRTNNLMAIGGVSVKGPNAFSFSTPQTLWINRTKTIECLKPVDVRLRGIKFTAPQLFYNWKDGILSCPQPVKVQATGAQLRAKQVQVNMHTHVLELKGGIEGEFDPKTADPNQLRGLSLEVR